MKTKEDYLKNHLLACPWLESPFAERLIDESHLSDKWKKRCRFYVKYGYLILDLDFDPKLIDGIASDMLSMSDVENKNYFYNPKESNKRLFHFWRKSQNAHALAVSRTVTHVLDILYNRPAFPFQTINFIEPSEQPAHSDLIHFNVTPTNWMSACWVALEDVDLSNGPLFVYPKSHKLPVYQLNDIGLRGPKYQGQGVGSNVQEVYQQYEQFMMALMEQEGLECKRVHLKKGEALFWAGNLVHGGSPLLEPGRTRLSQVTHYYFEGCQNYHCPLFSNSHDGDYSAKDLTKLDIMGHKFDEEV